VKAYFDFDRFEAIDEVAFSGQKPFPFVNPAGLLVPGAWEELEDELPPIELFEEKFGKKRPGGQMPHDRYSLEYTDGLTVSPSWHAFINELRSDRYRDNVKRLLGVRDVEFRFHWHYTPTARGVSPHIDQLREFGSHIFYFNAPDWQESWGGNTLIFESDQMFARTSAPAMEDFQGVIEAECAGNRSLLFQGGTRSWHGVRAIDCPPDHMRRVFIVVLNTTSLFWRVRDWIIGKKIEHY